jgi:SAM-dependent methyltransferase
LFKTVDSKLQAKIKEKTFAVFIVPQGQEKSWTFSTDEGLLDLLGQINTSRSLFVYLGHGFVFKDLLSVQEELKNVVLRFMPPVCNTDKVAFMTNGDIGEKALVYASPQVIVEDVKEGDFFLRQLIFVSNVNQVQSEIRIESGSEGTESIFFEGSLLPYPIQANYNFLTFECQRAMLLSLAFNPQSCLNNPLKLLLLGAGACVFPTFILNHFENIEITAVDIDRQVVEIGRRFFGVNENQKFHVFIEDALHFVENYSGDLLDFVFLDICIGDPNVQTPPSQFTSPAFTSVIHRILKNDGIFCVNLIGSDSQIAKMENEFKEVFCKVFKCKCKDDTNKIVFCFKEMVLFDWKDLVRGVKEIESVKKWDFTMQLAEYAGWVKVVEDVKNPAQAILQGKKKRRNKKKH